ncbi:MAG: type IV secretion system DNA-binding domain-containing protein [Candidatus Liptonbacteria bacterium]|nr:type IV secretion system DNA-binding domain-containing protein [Candidatus Liptonbacteria bacterium]
MSANPDKDVVFFAKTDFRGAHRVFGIRREDRRQHMYIVGKTGTGKTTLENNMIIQDIVNGEGLAVIDPHGDLVENILDRIPEHRMDDVVYFNPADSEYHIGFNILDLPDPKYKHLVASGLMGIFTKIWQNVWSARMEYIMNNAILALLDTPGSTLLGITRILVDKDYRQMIINNVKDPVVRSFWISEFESWRDQFRNEAIAPIQNKVGQFLSTALIRNIVGQAKSSISFDDLVNTGKVFLVNVSKGRIGEDNSALLGAMIITKLQLAAMERVRIPEEERVDFYLYVDEFQNFATDAFASILSEARKYRLDLIVAHQYIGQLVTDLGDSRSAKVRDAIFGNVGTMIMFRIGAADAEFLENEFTPEFTIEDMVNLPNRHVYLKLMVDGVTSRPFSAATLPPFKYEAAAMSRERIIQNARKRYARPNYQVEEEIAKSISGGGTMSLNILAEHQAQPPRERVSAARPGGGSGGPRPTRDVRPSTGSGRGQQGVDALAQLGIHFEPRKEESRPPTDRRSPERIMSNSAPRSAPSGAHLGPSEARPIIKSEVNPPPPAAATMMSLSDLKPRDRVPKHQPNEDVKKDSVDELRKSINAALNQPVAAEPEAEDKDDV